MEYFLNPKPSKKIEKGANWIWATRPVPGLGRVFFLLENGGITAHKEEERSNKRIRRRKKEKAAQEN